MYIHTAPLHVTDLDTITSNTQPKVKWFLSHERPQYGGIQLRLLVIPWYHTTGCCFFHAAELVDCRWASHPDCSNQLTMLVTFLHV